jgi:glycosyltransferase involved in cell wall biosynthesis
VVEGYLREVERLDGETELVLVPNACRDTSPEICRALAERYEAVRVVELADGGWGRAVRAGLAEARGDLLCYTNSARTQPAMLTLMLVYAAAYPNAVLKANRTIRDSFQRRVGSLLFNLECRALFDLPTMDVNGTPKVFPRELGKLLELERDDDLVDVEFMLTCRREGYPLLEVPILATERHGAESTTSYGSAIRLYAGAWRMKRELG